MITIEDIIQLLRQREARLDKWLEENLEIKNLLHCTVCGNRLDVSQDVERIHY